MYSYILGFYVSATWCGNLFLLSFSKFNGSYQGNAEIEGEWLIVDENGKVKNSAPVKINMPLQDDGYDALVDALSVGLNNLTDQIAAQL